MKILTSEAYNAMIKGMKQLQADNNLLKFANKELNERHTKDGERIIELEKQLNKRDPKSGKYIKK